MFKKIHSNIVGDVPAGIMAPQDNVSENILTYLPFRENTCSSYRVNQDIRAGLIKYSEQLRARKSHELWAAASKGSASDCLELGLRLWTGCGATKDSDSAVDWWRKVADPTHPEFVSSAPRPIHTKAMSCLAAVYLERSEVDRDTCQIDDFYRASKLADACASYGFISPIVLTIATKAYRMGLRRQADCTFRGVDTTRFETLEYLWGAYDARGAELDAEDQKLNAKVSKAPNLYQCGAEGCGIQATKSGLSKCAGKCPANLKPSYCSKECQRADWKRHRPLCKANAEPKEDQPENSSTSGSVALPTTIADNLRSDGKKHTIEWPAPGLPGEKTKVSSTTMTPAFMKEVRDVLEKVGGTKK